jgi:hypothetical protein
MNHPCNKCRAKGWYRIDPDTCKRIPCSRCNGTGTMHRLTPTEKRDTKPQKHTARLLRRAA